MAGQDQVRARVEELSHLSEGTHWAGRGITAIGVVRTTAMVRTERDRLAVRSRFQRFLDLRDRQPGLFLSLRARSPAIYAAEVMILP